MPKSDDAYYHDSSFFLELENGKLLGISEKQDDNGLEALARGSSDGLKLAANIAGMLIAFVAFISLINYLVG